MNILDYQEIKEKFSFYFEDEHKNHYFCNCGHRFFKDAESADKPEKKEEVLHHDEFEYLYKMIEIAEQEELRCPGCNKNFLSKDHHAFLMLVGKFFIGGYAYEDKDDNLILKYGEAKPVKEIIVSSSEEEEPNYQITFQEKIKHIRFEKESRRIYFKDYFSEEKEFDLDEVIKVVGTFFEQGVEIIYNLYHLHAFLWDLSKHVSDASNIDIVNGLLGEIRNQFSDAGIDKIKKIISIFFGIIKYSNLSTIALTKDVAFLYDMMKECDIPKPKVLIDNNVTSPIKIFNFLVKNYISKINDEINEDNKESHEFVFKSSVKMERELVRDEEGNVLRREDGSEVDILHVMDDGVEREMVVKYKTNDNYKSKVKKSSGKFEVISAAEDGSISKFIFKHIRRFSDYKQIMRYFKFFNKQQVINLMQNYELDYLVTFIDLIYFRDLKDIKEFDRLSQIVLDFVKIKTLEARPALNIENVKLDYDFVRSFDFVIYDDTIMMMDVLKFDPKRHFFKIKTFPELEEYHDNVVHFFNTATDAEKNEEFQKFVSRFRYLESREDYKGPIEFKLIHTPAMLIREGVVMRHSVGSYSRKVISKTYLIGQIYDRSPENEKAEKELDRFTIAFNFNERDGLEFDQMKGFGNQPASDRVRRLVMKFLVAKDISFKPLLDLKLTTLKDGEELVL